MGVLLLAGMPQKQPVPIPQLILGDTIGLVYAKLPSGKTRMEKNCLLSLRVEHQSMLEKWASGAPVVNKDSIRSVLQLDSQIALPRAHGYTVIRWKATKPQMNHPGGAPVFIVPPELLIVFIRMASELDFVQVLASGELLYVSHAFLMLFLFANE